MTVIHNSFLRLSLVAISILLTTVAFSQLKIGTNPTKINKSSILELESDRQGFLLPRLTDTLEINKFTPPDGMLIYLELQSPDGKGLYIRKAGIWQRFTTDSISLAKWSKSGDVLAGNEKLGSLNAQTIKIITNSIERLSIDGSSGNVAINKSLTVADSTTTGKLIVADSVKFKGLSSSDSLTEVLVINPVTGSVQRRTIATEAFKNLIVGPFSQAANASGLSRHSGPGTDTLILHAADATNAGGVSVTTQTFGGHKTFQDSLTAAQTLLVGGTGTGNSTLQVQGSVSLSIKTVTSTYTLTNADYTVLVNATGGPVDITLPTPSTTINGRTYVIKKIAGGLSNDVVVLGSIEDGTSISLYNDWTVLKVQTDGSKWYVIK